MTSRQNVRLERPCHSMSSSNQDREEDENDSMPDHTTDLARTTVFRQSDTDCLGDAAGMPIDASSNPGKQRPHYFGSPVQFQMSYSHG